jgi:hypothetical protein
MGFRVSKSAYSERAYSPSVSPTALFDARRRIVDSDGDSSVKSDSRKPVEFGFTEVSSTKVPEKPRLRFNNKFVLLAASALVFCASLGLAQLVKAEETFAVAGINSTLPAWAPTANFEPASQSHQQYADDSAFSALSSFVQQIEAGQSKRVSTADHQDDQALAALQDFAQRIHPVHPHPVQPHPVGPG